jgi:phosphatidylserine decarboxylase
MLTLLKFVPKNLLSYWTGKVSRIEFPTFIQKKINRIFVRFTKIDLAEAELNIDLYKSVSQVFSRKLKAGIRPIGEADVVAPCDSVLLEAGQIQEARLVQAKGISYSVEGLLMSREMAHAFQDGFFSTFYLCPADYHRVHSPVSGDIASCFYIPGHLWPVNAASVQQVESLYALNERVVVEIFNPKGRIIVVFVGATNVGNMSMAFDADIATNQGHKRERKVKRYLPRIPIKKGDELGAFHLGSTVVVLFDQNFEIDENAHSQFKGHRVKMGQNLTN